MDPIPWYKSPVYIGTLVSLISMAVVGLSLQQWIPIAAIDGYVQALFVLFGLIGGLVSERKRRKSDIQPLVASKAAVQEAIAFGPPPTPLPTPTPRGAALPVALVFSLMAVSVFTVGGLTGCATQRAAETVEQRAGALLGDFNIFQSAAIHIGEDTAVPAEVRSKVVNAAIGLKPAVDQLDELLRSYIAIKGELDAATSTDAHNLLQSRLQVAASRLNAWILDLTPKIAALRTALEGAFP